VFSSEEIGSLDPSLTLLRQDNDGSIYGSNGMLSSVGSDGNIYVERIFIANLTQQGRTASISAWSRIDCGRMLQSTLNGSMEVNGVKTETSNTEWRYFRSESIFAQTCTAAASKRGIDWGWYTN